MHVALITTLTVALAFPAMAGEKPMLAVTDAGSGTLSRDVPAAVDRMLRAGDNRLALGNDAAKAECIAISDVSDVLVCVFNTPRFMNYAINRASEWVEVSRKNVLTDREHVENALNDSVEGHDLRGADLRAFDAAWKKVAKSRVEGDDAGEKLRIERDFWTFLRKRLEKKPDLILLAVAAGTDIEGTLSHEILHAQYFRSKEMQAIVSAYWDAMPTADREAVERVLRMNYAIDGDRALLLNELQAYLLQYRAEDFNLKALVPAHRDALLAKLRPAGIAPIQFRLETAPSEPSVFETSK